MTTPTPEQAYRALRAGGLRIADPDLVRLFDVTQADYVERARAAKPQLFHFDARRAKPEEVEARLKEINSGLRRRDFHHRCDELLADLREGR